jgi:hypothetical protein
MRLSAESHAKVEQFFREHLDEPGLNVPRINFHGGLAGWLFGVFVGMSAITLGRRVVVSPKLFGRDEGGRATLPGRLVVHEVAHVLQYEERGFARFLRDYLRGYWRALREGGRWDWRGRTAAYMSIAEEREARAAEDAFAAGRTGGEDFTLR